MVETLLLDEAHERLARHRRVRERRGGRVQEELRARPQVPGGGVEGAVAAQPLEVEEAAGALGEREEPFGVLEGPACRSPAEHLVPEHLEGLQVDDGLVERDHVLLADDLVQPLQAAIVLPRSPSQAHEHGLVEGAVHGALGPQHGVAVHDRVPFVEGDGRAAGGRQETRQRLAQLVRQ